MLAPSRSFFNRFSLLGGFLCASLVFLAYFVQYKVPSIDEEGTFGSNLGFFLLVNLNIIVVLVLAFMVGKNIIKLVLDRRRKILGARLRSRLVAAFVGLSLIPTVLLFLIAKGILQTVLQGWFSPQINSSVDAALGVAKHHYEWQEAKIERNVNYIADKLGEMIPYVAQTKDFGLAFKKPQMRAIISNYLKAKQEEYGLSELALVNASGEVLARARDSSLLAAEIDVVEPNSRAIAEVLSGSSLVTPERSVSSEFLRGYAGVKVDTENSFLSLMMPKHRKFFVTPAESGAKPFVSPYCVVATVWVRPELNDTLAAVISSFDDYKELSNYRRPLASSYVLMLIIVTLMIVFFAVWVGFYLARSLSVPIQLLASGTQEVAQGNLDFRIPAVGDDELGVLVHSFNTMTEDLKRTTGELVARRRYMETVLASVGVGVVAVDRESHITTMNIAAGEMLGCENINLVLGSKLKNVFPEQLSDKVIEMLSELYASPEKVFTTNLSLSLRGAGHRIQITINKLVNEHGVILGAVILLDDLTELVNAQRMNAWREVARRIAHEIKNPLTPIQLSAERLTRRFRPEVQGGVSVSSDSSIDANFVSECSETIISQVATLRALVDEFSRFARMPKVERRPVVLSELIAETIAMYTEARNDIEFLLDLEQQVPTIDLDRNQIGRVLVNLIDNAIVSVETRNATLVNNTVISLAKGQCERQDESACVSGSNGFVPSIVISLSFDETLGLVTVLVSDNGMGISETDKQKLFEPYFSTRKGGTGLGLAIVSTIIADHDGFIRVRDNQEGGATFIIELPVTRDVLRQQA